MDLQNAYDDLDRYRCLEIMTGYGVGPRMLHILRTYWGRIQMVDRARSQYVPLFKGYYGMTHGDPLYPTIFNMFVDTVIRHWVMDVSPAEAGKEGLSDTVEEMVL